MARKKVSDKTSDKRVFIEGSFDKIVSSATAEEVEFSVKPYLSVAEQVDFCNQVVDIVFPDGVYAPALYDFAVRFETLLFYTNIELKDDANLINSLIYGTDVYSIVLERIKSDGQYGSLLTAIDNMIEDKNAAIHAFNPVYDNMYFSITSLVDTVSVWLHKLGSELNEKLNDADGSKLENLNALANRLSQISDKDIIKELAKTDIQ